MAIYNNGYPVSYPQLYAPMQNQQQTQNNAIIWVQGESGAKSYLVAPNNTVVLFDSEDNVIYLKSADSSGMPSIRVLDYTFRENSSQTAPNGFLDKNNFVTKEEFDKFKSEVLKNIKKEEAKDGELPF